MFIYEHVSDKSFLSRVRNLCGEIMQDLCHFIKGNQTEFSIDVCIVCRDTDDNYYRLIHEKTGCTYCDKYYWNQAPDSAKVREKARYIKNHGRWISGILDM